MGIEIIDSLPDEALNYNRIFMSFLNVEQQRLLNISQPPVYDIKVNYYKYATKADGTIVMGTKLNKVIVNDYLTEALQMAQQGDMTMITALKAIEDAVATIIQHKHNLNVSSV